MKTIQNHTRLNLLLSRLAIIAFLLPWMTMTAQDFKKTYQEKYAVDKGATLAIQNKFGDINCQAWDESTVSILVEIKVDASSQEKADRVFDKIKVDLSGSRTKVLGITTVGNINNVDFSIDYEIRMPKWIKLDFDNKFGDIILDKTDGATKINLEYGAMEANALNGPNTDLNIKFSKVEAGFIHDGIIHIEYSELELEEAGNLKIYSRFSELKLEKLAQLNLDSQYDDVNVESSGPVISISRFSDLEFEKVDGDFDFDTEYGEVTLDYITPAFKTGRVRNSFAGVSLNFDPGASMKVNAEMQFGELSYPRGNTSLSQETVGYTKNIYTGRIGTASSPSSQLTINSKNAGVKIDFED